MTSEIATHVCLPEPKLAFHPERVSFVERKQPKHEMKIGDMGQCVEGIPRKFRVLVEFDHFLPGLDHAQQGKQGNGDDERVDESGDTGPP